MKRRLKINGLITFLAFLSLVLFPTVFLRNGQINSLEAVTEIFGITFIMLGQVLRASSRGYKSEHSKGGRSLIQSGPYALVRNPMYLGILLVGLGIVLMLFRWWVLGIFLLVFIARYLLPIFKEEKRLLVMFPEGYQDYCKRVPRILPSIATLLQKDISEYLPLKLPWLKKEIGSILVVLLMTLFIESWEDIKNGGLVAYFKESIIFLAIIILFICMVIYLSRRTAKLEKDASSKSKNTL